MTIHLLRHVRAGRRSAWTGDDEARPASKVGRRQAKDLAVRFADLPVTAVVSSPYVRCVQSVAPLAKGLGLTVVESPALAEGAGIDDVLDLIASLDGDAVLCTHGDVVQLVLDQVRRDGVKLRKPRLEKGSVWALERRASRFTDATYQRPPRLD